VLGKSWKNSAVRRALFLSSVALGTAGILSGSWMVVHGHLLYATGLIGSILPLSMGIIGLHKLRRSTPILN
jgi:hypothetical protein